MSNVSDDDVSDFQSEEEVEVSGGEDDDEEEERELGDDDYTIEIDPDHEKDYDLNDDELFDPVEEMDETIDPDEELSEGVEGFEEDEEEVAGEEEEEEKVFKKAEICHMKNLEKDLIILDTDDSDIYDKLQPTEIPKDKRTSGREVTRYEMTRILGTRARQLELGAPPYVAGLDHLEPQKVATVELRNMLIPFIIKRHFPGKKYEMWSYDEMELIHDVTDEFFDPGNVKPKS